MSAQDSSTEQTDRLKKLIAANQALAQVESLDELLPNLLNAAKDVTRAVAASILLYKPESNTLEFSLAVNEEMDAAQQIFDKKIELQLGEGIAGYVAQERKSMMVKDAQENKHFSGKVDKDTGFVTRSILCTPILYQDDLLGVVQVLNSKDKNFFDQDDLDILESFSHLAAVALVRSKLLEIRLNQERMQVQLDAAARIQSSFLPKIPDLGTKSDVFAITEPAIFVGGDFYDIIPLPDKSILVCVADVSGKGLPAALVGVSIWTRIRGLVSEAAMPGELLYLLNGDMYDVLAQQLFATMVVGRYWPENGKASLALAGHLPPMRVLNGETTYVTDLKGPPIGIDPSCEFSQMEIQLEPGESLMFLTDGVSEARNKRRQFFGDENVEVFLKKQKEAPYGPNLVKHIKKWRGNIDANDDLTVVELWRTLES